MQNKTEDGGNNWNSIEASRIWEKRDEETRDAYITSSYRSGRVHEEKEVRAVCDTCPQALQAIQSHLGITN